MIYFLKVGTLITFVMSLVLISQFWTYRRSNLVKLYCFNLSIYTVWAFSVLLTLLADDLETKIFFTKTRQLLNPYLSVNWLATIFIVFYGDIWKKIRWAFIPLYVIPITTSLCTLLSLLGLEYFEGRVAHTFQLMPDGIGLVSYLTGPNLKLQFQYAGILMLIMIALYFTKMASSDKLQRRLAWLFMTSSALHIGVEFLSRSKWGSQAYVQLSIASTVPSLLTLYYAVRKYEFLNIKRFLNQVAFEHLPSPVLALNPRNEIWDANLQARQLLKITSADFGQKIDQDHRFHFLSDSTSQLTFDHKIFQVQTRTLEESWIQNKARIVTLVDVTEIQSLNDEMHESNAVLSRMNNEILQMTELNKKIHTLLSHDLIPLVRTEAYLINGLKNALPPSEHSLIETINKTSNSILDLLENTLTWSHAETPQKTDLMECLAKCIELTQPLRTPKNIQIQIKQTGLDNSSPLKPILTTSHPLKLKAIFRNILSNAIKFSPQNGIVDINIIDQHEDLLMIFKDEGVGFSKEQLEILNSKKWHPTKSESGFGIGLQITLDFVQQISGKIEFKNQSSLGAEVLIRIPKKGSQS